MVIRFMLDMFCKLVRVALRLRYKIKIKNREALSQPKIKKGGYLILPNHPAEIDPIIMMTLLWKKFRPRPLVVEHFFNYPGAKMFMNGVKAIPIPNFESAVNDWKKEKGDLAFKEVLEGLKRGENFLIYPAGHLRRGPKEAIGGSSFIHNILQEYPDVNIVMARMSGLWGSSFSRAITGTVPHFWRVALNAIWTLLKSGIFFAPRRKVDIEFYNPQDRFPYKANKMELNLYLQNYYNRFIDEEGRVVSQEPLLLIPYSPFSKKTPKIIAQNKKEDQNGPLNLSQEQKKRIIDKIASFAHVSSLDIDQYHDLSIDLGLDSLDIATLFSFICEEFDVDSKIEPGELKTVHDLYVLAANQKQGTKSESSQSKKPVWKPFDKIRKVRIGKGSSIPEVFMYAAKERPNIEICADGNSGTMTYKKLSLATLILAKKIEKMPGQYVGIMLPSSIGSYLLILATQLAGKTPVMLNWTSGLRSLNYAIEVLNIEVILSATKFLDRLQHLHLEEIKQKIVLVEDVKKSITLKDKLKALFTFMLPVKRMLKSFGVSKRIETDPAVVLFTSGTESYPKAVPLSHKNILSNLSALLSTIELKGDDVLYGVLPPFHSFGFTVTGLLPLLAGFRAYYSPDPTDGQMIRDEVKHAQCTILCLAPSFYQNFFKFVVPEDMKSVRLFVSGAEKASDELKKTIRKFGEDKLFLEGYGITECSPAVTACENNHSKGVGRALHNLEVCTIHIDTHEKLPEGASGEICVRGPSIFYGYLGNSGRDPFIEIEGKKWYRTGDIGFFDPEGNLILQGRLKRFVKIGGEMISLTSIEEELINQSKNKGWADDSDPSKSFVVCVKELEEGRPQVILFTTSTITKEEVNYALRESGFGRIVKISEVRRVDELPLLGSGKINYRQLNEMIHA